MFACSPCVCRFLCFPPTVKNIHLIWTGDAVGSEVRNEAVDGEEEVGNELIADPGTVLVHVVVRVVLKLLFDFFTAYFIT